MCSGNCGQPCCGEKETAKMSGFSGVQCTTTRNQIIDWHPGARARVCDIVSCPNRDGTSTTSYTHCRLISFWEAMQMPGFEKMNTQSAKMGGFSFNDIFGGGNINGGGFGNSYGDPSGGGSANPNLFPDLGDLAGIAHCASLGLQYPCDSGTHPAQTPSNYPTNNPQPQSQPTQGSAGGGNNSGGLSDWDKLFALVLGTAPNIINSIRGNQYGVPTNAQGQVLTTGTNPGAANTLAQVGANTGAAAGSFTQGIFTFISQNPLLTLAVLGGGALLLMPSPRSSRNGTLKLIPNPKRRTRRRRR